MFASFTVLLVLSSILGAPKDSYDYQEHRKEVEAAKFETSFLLWAGLNDNTRLKYYSDAVGGGAAAANAFSSFRAQKESTILERQMRSDALGEERSTIEDDAKGKAYVKEDKIAAVAAAGAGAAAGVGAGRGSAAGAAASSSAAVITTETRFSQETYQSELKREEARLKAIDREREANDQVIAREKARINTSSAYAANAVAAAEREADYIANLEMALQAGFTPTQDYRQLDTYKASQPRTEKTVAVEFQYLGRIVVKSDGKFSVMAKNTRTGQVTGVTSRQPKYRHFCIINPDQGDTYSVRIESDSAITVAFEELF